MTYDPLRLRIIWNNTPPVTPFMGYRDLHVAPEPEYPFGRKGLALQTAWDELGPSNNAIGMLLLDGDVAIDPHDNRMMHEAIYSDVESIWIAPIRLWPVSHLAPTWLWGHGKDGLFSQEDVPEPNMFSFCFTYLPEALIYKMIGNGLSQWRYPQVDMFTWETAQEFQIPVRKVTDSHPKHMHW
jgi:hypothetical protein